VLEAQDRLRPGSARSSARKSGLGRA